MRLCKTGLLACLAVAFAQDASRTLEQARDKILSQVTHLPKLVCVETIDRSYFSRPNPPDPPPSCEQIAIDRKKGRNRPKLDYTDRVRVAVTFTRDREIFSWTGSAPISYSVEDILNPGPIGTGAFAAHLIDIFGNPSVRSQPRFFIHGYSPQVHAAASVAGKIEISAVGRPDRVPIHMVVICNADLRSAFGGGRADIASPIPQPPVSDPIAMWRPVWLERVVGQVEKLLISGFHVDNQ